MTSANSPTRPDPASELTTDRLILRSWTSGEATAVSDDTRGTGWAEDFPDEGDRVIAGLFDKNPAWLGPYGHRLIVERESATVVGSIGLFWPPADGAVELGYGVVSSRRGRGYATEATVAVAEFALTAPEVHTVFATADLSNPASIRVLEKAGFGHRSTDGGTVRFAFGKS